MMSRLILPALCFLSVTPEVAFPQEPSSCASIRAAADRLACYDRLQPPVAGAETLRSNTERQQQAQREFGLSAAQRESTRQQPPAVDKVSATIRKVSNLGNGQRRVELEDGQSWLLTEATLSGPLKDGDSVQFRKAAMGTFMLITPRGVALRAKRIK